MKTAHIRIVRSLRFSLLVGMAILLFSPVASQGAVSFNFDFEFNLNGAPPNTFGGDSGQTGFWNASGAGPGIINVFDLSGAVDTGVDAFIQILNGGSGLDPFYSDFILGFDPRGPNVVSWSFQLSSFPTGQHALWVYASDQAATGAFTVDDGNGSMNIGSVAVSGSVSIPINATAGTVTVTGPADGTGQVAGFQVVAVPEPGSAALAGLALIALWGRRRRVRGN